jgi:hypothetical protein
MEQNNGRAAFLGGYSTPDGFRHAILATRGGELHEVFFNPQKGEGIARLGPARTDQSSE